MQEFGELKSEMVVRDNWLLLPSAFIDTWPLEFREARPTGRLCSVGELERGLGDFPSMDDLDRSRGAWKVQPSCSPASRQPGQLGSQGQGKWSEVKATQCIRGGTVYPPLEISRAWGTVSFTWCFPSFTKEFREYSPSHHQQPHKAKGLLLGLTAPNRRGAKKKVLGVLEVSEVEKKENLLKLSTINWHLPRALPTTEQQRHLPSASLEMEGFPGGSDGKASACNVGDPGWIPGSGQSPGERNGNHRYSCLENPMDGGTQWDTVHGVRKGRTRLSFLSHIRFSTEIEPHAAIAVDLHQPLREFRVEWGALFSRESGGTGL